METFLAILGAVIGIAMLVGIYYLLKICFMYILTALIGGVVLGLITAFIGSQIVPDYTAEIGIVGAGIGAVLGLIFAISRTKDIAKMDLAKDVVDSITHTDPNGTVYTARDQYGNKMKVKKTGTGVLGETYYEDSKGNLYEKDYGNNELK